jgi:ABC-type polysaccharide/polyol phosphate export permease
MNALRIARKTLLEYLREPQLLWIILLGPVVLTAVMYSIYLPARQQLSSYLRVIVHSEDEGPAGGQLIAAIREHRWDGDPVFRMLDSTDRETALVTLRENKAALLLEIPRDFSAALESAQRGEIPAVRPAISYTGDPLFMDYLFARGFIDPIARHFIWGQSGYGLPPDTAYEPLPGTGTNADFDSMIPGLLVFGMLFLIISTATTLVREENAHTLLRLRLTGDRSGTLLAGVGLAQVVLAVGMTLMGFGTALALGYGGGTELLQPYRIAALIAICLLFSVPVIALGMIVGAYCRTDGDAANLGTLFLVPMVFLTGILFPMPQVPLFSIGSQVVNLYDIVPSSLAAEAIRRAVTFGEGPAALLYPLAGLLLETAVLLGLGLFLYQKRKLDPQPAG